LVNVTLEKGLQFSDNHHNAVNADAEVNEEELQADIELGADRNYHDETEFDREAQADLEDYLRRQ